MKLSVAILGLGVMGSGMASRLLNQGFSVAVYNRSIDKARLLGSLGAIVCNSPKDAASKADVIISMLADDVASRKVWLGDDGALAGAKPNAILIESSTVTVGWIKELSQLATAAKHQLIDAPVTGSKNHAATGELTFLVGGSVATLDQVRPVLEAMSRQIIHLGRTGSGAMMKLINNFVCGVQAVALAEGIAAIERAGLSLDTAVKVLTEGAPGSPIVKILAQRMLAKHYDPNFSMRLIAKDLTYAASEAGETEIGAAALETFGRGIEAGFGDRDFSAVVEVLRDNATTKVSL